MSTAVAEPKPKVTTPSPAPIALKRCPRCGRNVSVFADGDADSVETITGRFGMDWQLESEAVCRRCQVDRDAEADLAQRRQLADASVFNQQLALVRGQTKKQLEEAGLWGDLPEVSRIVLHRLIELSPSKGGNPQSLTTRKWSATCRRIVELLDGYDDWRATDGD